MIARAIIMDPDVLVADEPISMLDMSVRAKILQLMIDLKQDLGLTYVYITHDLASAKYFCDRIAIMYLGRIVEIGPTEEIFANPRHPYTKALLAAIPDPDPDASLPRDLPRGEIPDAASPPLGCAFHPRCPAATPICGWESRDLRTVVEEHWIRRTPEVYAAEQGVVGNLDHLDKPATAVTIGERAARTTLRLARPDAHREPRRTALGGVDAIERDGRRRPSASTRASTRAARARDGVEVACVLYPATRRHHAVAAVQALRRRLGRLGHRVLGRCPELEDRQRRDPTELRTVRMEGAPFAESAGVGPPVAGLAARPIASQSAWTLRSVASRSLSSGRNGGSALTR